MKKNLSEKINRRVKMEINLRKLKNIKINKIYYTISKNCWKYDVQYVLIYKDKDLLDVVLIGEKYEYYLRFEKSSMVDKQKIEEFKDILKQYNIQRAIYITTGVFYKKTLMESYGFPLSKLWLRDGNDFIKDQKSIDKINFYKYFPR